ncbi:hypothetical protein HRbin01_01444 [archaeon HR01]|nr:hypothetical protein HRbin01_01444 [archaeon HR01]
MIKYGAGALVTILVSAGALLILGGSGAVSVEPLTALGLVLSIFGIYTAVYGASSKDQLYYILWGGISLVIGVGLAASNIVNPFIAAGVALVFLAVLAAYSTMRRRG